MQKRGNVKFIITALVIFAAILTVMPGVLAEVFISQPQSLYNFGDELNVTITVSPIADSNNFLTAKLKCGTNEMEILRSIKNIQAGQQASELIRINLDNALVGNLSGECYISASYGDDVAISQKFDIVRGITVQLELDKITLNPGESVVVSGDAVKRNGNSVEGFVELSLPNINLSLSNIVSNGAFSFMVTIPENTASGNYEVKTRVYEKDSGGNIVNEGGSSSSIKINQIVKASNLSITAIRVIPGTDLVYNVYLYDQANQEVSNDVVVALYNPGKEQVSKKLVKSLVPNTFAFAANATPGTWRIETSYDNLVDSAMFDVEKVMSATFVVINGTLVITNTGNVPYTKPLQVSVGEKLDVVSMNIGVGEADNVKLSSPNAVNGTYSIKVNDGNQTADLGEQYFAGTGNAVLDVSKPSFWGWLILIVIIIIGGVYYYKKSKKKSAMGGSSGKMGVGPIKANIAKGAEASKASIIDSGEKQSSTLVALKIKNLQDIEKSNTNAMETVNKVLMTAKDAKAKIYADGNYRLMIFAPIITKNPDNNVDAIKVASEIKRALEDYNKKFAQKIEYGIGVHYGDLAVEAKAGQFRFSSLGNTIPIVKRIAESSHGEVLMSSQIHTRTMGTVKGERVGESSFFQVKNIINRGEHSGFIKGFIKRQDQEKGKK